MSEIKNREITWLDFQLSTDNQNGRHLATEFFFDLIFFSDFSQNLVGYIDYGFSRSASLLTFSVFVCERKQGYGGHLVF